MGGHVNLTGKVLAAAVVVERIDDDHHRHDVAPAALAEPLERLEGAFALGIVFAGHEDLLIAARRGSPLIVGVGEGEHFLASDASAIVSHTRTVICTEHITLGCDGGQTLLCQAL